MPTPMRMRRWLGGRPRNSGNTSRGSTSKALTAALNSGLKVSFEVDQVIGKTVGLIEENFHDKGIGIKVACTGDPLINGFPNEFGQVIFNLLMNAKCAFIERGVSDAWITISSRVQDGRAVVTVTDNAGGIKEQILQKIFDAFFTTRELGKGSGVGLFIAKNIIEKQMGGRLSARNVDGGAEFRIEV